MVRVALYNLFYLSLLLLRARKNPVKVEELADKRKQNQGKRKAAKDEEFFKSYECKRFKQGLCDLGDNCRYTHDTPSTLNENEDDRK